MLIAAAACEIHPRALLKGAELRSTREALERASAEVPGQVPVVVEPSAPSQRLGG